MGTFADLVGEGAVQGAGGDCRSCGRFQVVGHGMGMGFLLWVFGCINTV